MMLESEQLDYLLILLRATPACKNVDFHLTVAKCRAAVAAATSKEDLARAVATYESDRAQAIYNVIARLPGDEAAAVADAFYQRVDFQSATHTAPEIAS